MLHVAVGSQVARGNGPNKKLAKRAAAENLLQTMGYSRPQPQPSKPALKMTNSGDSTHSHESVSTNGSSGKVRKNIPVVTMCWVTFFALCFVIFLILSLCSETSCSWCRFIKCCREPVARETQLRGTPNVVNKMANLNHSQEFPC
eukprot:TCALIF_10493-PA protein Name:"Similar to STAU1 Double-stranded RNA-binding protein Staufen homolog 1 (Ailuropoda melanoleuca)" AED:0.43 eAED:0.43 QI:0/0/0.33/0.66/1/1/3/106/144